MRNVLNFLYGFPVTIALVFNPFKHYFLTNSHFKRNIERICIEKYNISNVLSNDLDAINARIKYVQDRDPNSIFNMLNVMQ